jgi:DNA-binding transcriptional LysR family regulator
VEREPSDPAAVIDGRERTHAELRTAADALGSRHAFDPATVLLAALPLCDSLEPLYAAVAAGAVVTLLPDFDVEEARALIERDDVTVLHGTAPMLAALGDVGVERCVEPSSRFERKSSSGRLPA